MHWWRASHCFLIPYMNSLITLDCFCTKIWMYQEKFNKEPPHGFFLTLPNSAWGIGVSKIPVLFCDVGMSMELCFGHNCSFWVLCKAFWYQCIICGSCFLIGEKPAGSVCYRDLSSRIVIPTCWIIFELYLFIWLHNFCKSSDRVVARYLMELVLVFGAGTAVAVNL